MLQIAQNQPFDHARREDVQPGKGHGAPEGDLHKAIGQATAKRNARAVGSEVIAIILGKLLGALAIAQAALRVDILHKMAVDQAIEMEGAGDVVIARFTFTVAVPAVAQPEGFDGIEMPVDHRHVIFTANAFQTQLNQHREKVPVIVRHGDIRALAEPAHEVILFRGGQRLPQSVVR